MQSSFIGVFDGSRLKNETMLLLDDLLTPTEKIMMTKRLAIIFMLNEGYSFRAIEKSLKVTLQTVTRFWKMKKRGKFKYLEKMEIKSSSFWKDLEKFLQAGLPPRGKGRWKHVFETMDKADRLQRRIYKGLYK